MRPTGQWGEVLPERYSYVIWVKVLNEPKTADAHITSESITSLITARNHFQLLKCKFFSCCFPWFFRHLSFGPFWNSCGCDCRLVMLAPELCGLPGTSGLDATRFCWTKIRLCSREVSFDHQQHTWFCWDACFLWLFFVNCFRIKYLLQGFERAIICVPTFSVLELAHSTFPCSHWIRFSIWVKGEDSCAVVWRDDFRWRMMKTTYRITLHCQISFS